MHGRSVMRPVLYNALSPQDPTATMTRWLGDAARHTQMYRPGLGADATIKSHGFWATNWGLRLSPGDNRVIRLNEQAFTRLRAAGAQQAGAGSDNSSANRGIPSVFVPTSLSNNYSGWSTQ
jgi:hypothetical protein